MSMEYGILEIYKPGKLTVVGFGGEKVIDGLSVAQCREEITDLISEHDCSVLAVDLTGLKLIPSGLLGLLASLRNVGVQVLIYNACEDIREVLEITKLDQVMEVHEVDIR